MDTTKVNLPTRPIKNWQRMKELRRAHFKHTWQAQERGELVIQGVEEAFLGVLAGMGDFANPTYGPYFTRLMRDKDSLRRVMEAVDASGYGHSICSAMRAHLGQHLLGFGNKTPEGKPFKPDFIFQFYLCNSVAKMAQLMGEMQGVPWFNLVVPHGDGPSHREYLVDQCQEAIEWMEKVTGRKYDDEKLIEATKNEWETMVLWAKICEQQKNIPAPLDVRMMWSLRLPTVVGRHKREVVEFYRDLLEEVHERVRDGISARGFERARLMGEGGAFFDPSLMRLPEEYGCVYVAGQATFETFAAWDIAKDGTWTSAPTWQERGLPMNTREDALRAQAELYLAHFPIYINYAITRRHGQWGKIARDWHCDGVVMGLGNGCPAGAAGATEKTIELRQEGWPLAVYDSSMVDPRDFNRDKVVDTLDAFFESLGLKKMSKVRVDAEEDE